MKQTDRAGRCAIAIMAKAPDAARVKTRLSPLLRPDEARELSACFLRDMTQTLARAGGAAAIDGYIAFAPAGSEASFAPMVAPGTRFVLADGAIDVPANVVALGRSLLHAARALFARGYGAVGLLNADSPTLPAELMVEATRLLAAPGERAVLGPATDGGYYFIGLKAPHAELFADIDWSSARVATQTRAAAQGLGLAVAELASWYDVDDRASLNQLVRDCEANGDGAPATAAWLARNAIARRLAEAELSLRGS